VWQRRRGARWALAAAGLYAEAFAVTMALNVPLNEQLAAAGPPDRIPDLIPDLAAVRVAFEGPWVRWNLLRTVLTTVALAALVVALTRRSRPCANRSRLSAGGDAGPASAPRSTA